MITILHGDNLISSRERLTQLIAEAKHSGVKDIVHFNAQKIDLTNFQQAIESQSLFGSDRLIVIEDLFKGQTSKQKKALISYIKTQTQSQIIIWESKKATTPQIKSLGSPQNFEFKLQKSLFNFLDSLTPDNPTKTLSLLDQTLAADQPELVFAMLIRQTRLLLQLKGGAPLKLAPWQASKLKSQAAKFSQNQLLALHKRLLDIDISVKTGNNLLSLPAQLDTLITNL